MLLFTGAKVLGTSGFPVQGWWGREGSWKTPWNKFSRNTPKCLQIGTSCTDWTAQQHISTSNFLLIEDAQKCTNELQIIWPIVISYYIAMHIADWSKNYSFWPNYSKHTARLQLQSKGWKRRRQQMFIYEKWLYASNSWGQNHRCFPYWRQWMSWGQTLFRHLDTGFSALSKLSSGDCPGLIKEARLSWNY